MAAEETTEKKGKTTKKVRDGEPLGDKPEDPEPLGDTPDDGDEAAKAEAEAYEPKNKKKGGAKK